MNSAEHKKDGPDDTEPIDDRDTQMEYFFD